MDANATRVVLVAVLVVVALVVAALLRRRRPDAPTGAGREAALPSQLDRADFDGPATEWLVVVFTSATCDSCAGVVARAEPLASDSVVVQDVSYQARKDLHTRYGIDAVPTLLVADGEGVVRSAHIGPVTSADLWATLADLRG